MRRGGGSEWNNRKRTWSSSWTRTPTMWINGIIQIRTTKKEERKTEMQTNSGRTIRTVRSLNRAVFVHYPAVIRLYLMIIRSVFLRPKLRTVHGAVFFDLERNRFDFQNKIRRPIYHRYNYHKIRSQLLDEQIYTSHQITINKMYGEVIIGFESSEEKHENQLFFSWSIWSTMGLKNDQSLFNSK